MAPDVHRVGMAMSVGLDIPGFDASLGTAGLFGHGQGLAYDTADETAPYHRTAVRDATLFVFITGMRSAVNKLVKTAEEKLRELREGDAPEPDPKASAEPAKDEPARAVPEAAAEPSTSGAGAGGGAGSAVLEPRP
jgi:hypothetical protein